jgi:hypothetical protein
MRILMDMDDVLADFDGEFLRRWRERTLRKCMRHLKNAKPST